MPKAYRKYRSWIYEEGTTAAGQLVSLTCAPEDKDAALSALESIRTITAPVTRRVKCVGHGSDGQCTRFRIVQHKYAGGGHSGAGGWIEVLEIKDPPGGRHGIVVYEYQESDGRANSRFSCFATLEQAVAAWENCWSGGSNWKNSGERIAGQPGFIKAVDCLGLDPWFYAIANQALCGDMAVPNTGFDHPVWRPMKRYVVYPQSDAPDIATLLTVDRVTSHRDDPYGGGGKKERHILVLVFDSGVQVEFDENDQNPPVRPFRGEELWIADAVDRFRSLLAGKTTKFEIPFTNGGSVRIAYHQPKGASANRAGHYKFRLKVDGKPTDTDGDFVPTAECPTIGAWVDRDARRAGKTVLIVSCVRTGSTRDQSWDSKKWSGVYADPFKK
jgi:hypothetical protein